MGLASLFRGGTKYFDKNIQPKCDYCQFGKRAKDGNKVLCEKKGLVNCDSSCSKFLYSPLKRIPVKQLNFVGSLADEDIYIESASERAEKEAAEKEAAEKEATGINKSENSDKNNKNSETKDTAKETAESDKKAVSPANDDKAAEPADKSDSDAASDAETSAEANAK